MRGRELHLCLLPFTFASLSRGQESVENLFEPVEVDGLEEIFVAAGGEREVSGAWPVGARDDNDGHAASPSCCRTRRARAKPLSRVVVSPS